jgi:NADH dehydrogenase
MAQKVVVLGSGYAGAGAIQSLEDELDDAEITWISDNDYHLVLHEAHRIIRDPSVQDKITIPVRDIKSPTTDFRRGTVTGVNNEDREVELADGDTVDYDYLVVAIGSSTAYYGIPGLEEHALTLKSLDDALEIHEQIQQAARSASHDDPATVVVGGAGLSGIQSAGEVAAFRDRHNAPIDIYLVEALEEIFPPGDAQVQGALRYQLEKRDIDILTNDPITEADEDAIHFDERDSLEYDVFEWAGGIAGRAAFNDTELENEHGRVNAGADFQTSDERVFALGDSAVIDQGGERPAPPTAQAAWDAAEVVGENVRRVMDGQPLREWHYEDKGTLISVGDTAIAHNVNLNGFEPPVRTFNSLAAKSLKKGAAARWIASISSWDRAVDAWSVL